MNKLPFNPENVVLKEAGKRKVHPPPQYG